MPKSRRGGLARRRPRLVASVALALLVAGCGSDTDTVAELEQRIEELESQSADPTEATTTTVTTTTTTTPTTTTTRATTIPTSSYSTQFRPTDPSEEDKASYVLAAITLLSETPYSYDAVGDEFAVMLREGGLATCQALFAGDPISDAMYAGLQETPAAGIPPEELGDFGSPEATLATLYLQLGTNTYCPELQPAYFADFDKSRAAAEVVAAWEELTGG